MGDYVDGFTDADGSFVRADSLPTMRGNWTEDERLAIQADIRRTIVLRDSCNPNHDMAAIERYQRHIDAQTHALDAFTNRFSA